MINPYGETHTIRGYRVEIYPGTEPDTIEYITAHYTAGGHNYGTIERKASIRLCAWAKRLHGNPPSGTQYGSARIILPNGERVTFPVYI